MCAPSYRKELESKLDADGDSCLLDPSVVDAHPIIFWNLIWYFERVAVRSHLVGHCLRAASLNPEPAVAHESWAGCDHGNVFLGLVPYHAFELKHPYHLLLSEMFK